MITDRQVLLDKLNSGCTVRWYMPGGFGSTMTLIDPTSETPQCPELVDRPLLFDLDDEGLVTHSGQLDEALIYTIKK